MERKGPHKSMHCKFCKPPGYLQEKPSAPTLATKTKLHLVHQGADLKVFDVSDEPGTAPEEVEACVCQIAGFVPCPKCAPDKKRLIKKTVCDCPVASTPVVPDFLRVKQKKKKVKDDDYEWWWEKYDREHDAWVKEAWAEFMAQRKFEKSVIKCKERAKNKAGIGTKTKPKWFQKLSCQQTIHLEYLAAAIRLDIDENITERTSCILTGIGLYPIPGRKVLEKCLRYCHYNAIRFLEQLTLLVKETDPFKERVKAPKMSLEKQDLYAWNDRILMACICYLEFPNLLREIMDRLPPLPQQRTLPPLRLPKFPKIPKIEYETPYDEPLWRERLNWIERQKYERINRAREHMKTKRVKIPALALVRRQSLVDARPAFLNQILPTAQSIHRSKKHKKNARMYRMKETPIFDSKVDVTAIAGIEASEISTPKADSEDICVFLRETSKSESLHGEEEEELFGEYYDEEQEEEQSPLTPAPSAPDDKQEQMNLSSGLSIDDNDEFVVEEDEGEDIPFVTPPKTRSGATIEEPCLAPKSSLGPPAFHYDEAKKELGVINQELCAFDPNGDRSDDRDIVSGFEEEEEGTEENLKRVAEKLKEFDSEIMEEEEDEPDDYIMKEPEKKKRKKKKKKKSKSKTKSKKKEKKSETGRIRKKEKKPEEFEVCSDEENLPVVEEDMTEYPGEQEEDDFNGSSTGSCVCNEDRMKKKEQPSKKKQSKRKKKQKKSKKEDLKKKCRPKKKKAIKKKKKKKKIVNKNKKKNQKRKNMVQEANLDNTMGDDSLVAESDKLYRGDVGPLLRTILNDLSEEGYISAGYEDIEEHPDIKQLIKHLQGQILNQKLKRRLHALSRLAWKNRAKARQPKMEIPDLNISTKTIENATWNDKLWITRLTNRKKEEFYFNIAKKIGKDGRDFYLTLNQEYFGNERFLASFFAYQIPKKQECIMRGLQ